METLRRLSEGGQAVFARDASERIIFWSPKCEEVLGLPAASALGRHCHDVIGGRDAYGNVHCLHNCRIAHQARDGAEPVHTFPLSARTKEGWKQFDVDTFSIPSFHPSLSIVGHVLRERRAEDRPPGSVPGKGNGDSPAEPLRPIGEPGDQLAVLTRREREILALLSRGLRTAEIATELRISTATVRNHTAAILQRLDVHSKLAAVALTYRNHFL
jgi:DNA-binding CsgD family transcriptional regulator